MKVEFKAINESDFKVSDSEVIFNTEHSRCHGIVFNEEISFKFGWQSELIIPKVDLISEGVYSLGIDLNFAVIDFEKNKIVFDLLLDYFFYEIKVQKDFLYVITALSIFKIELGTFRIIETFLLPDFFEQIIFDKKRIEVKCSNNEIAHFQI